MELYFLASAAGGGFSLDASFWALIGLIAFLGLLAKLGVHKSILGGLDARGEQIREQLDEARQLREEAQTLLAEYQRKRKEAEDEAQEIIEAAEREAAAVAAEAERKTEEFIARRTSMAEQKIAQAEADALSSVKSAAVEKAIGAASKIIAEQTEGKAGNDLIKASIAEVKAHFN